MTSIVDISASSEALECPAGERASVAFQVTNQAGRRLKLGAQVVVEPPLEKVWLAIGGRKERRVAAGGETSFELTVSVPADGPAGEYRFGLLVFDSIEPGESFDESPSVTLRVLDSELPAPPPQPPQRARRSWLSTGAVFVGAWIWTPVAMFLMSLFDVLVGTDAKMYVFGIESSYWKSVAWLVPLPIIGGLLTALPTRYARPWWLIVYGALFVPVAAWLSLQELSVVTGVLLSIYAYLFWKRTAAQS